MLLAFYSNEMYDYDDDDDDHDDDDPLASKGNYSATSNNTKLVHWPLMGGLLHLVQWGGAWVGSGPAQSRPCCTKCNSPPINVQCTNHCIDNFYSLLKMFLLLCVSTAVLWLVDLGRAAVWDFTANALYVLISVHVRCSVTRDL